jgi:hypothetical protein
MIALLGAATTAHAQDKATDIAGLPAAQEESDVAPVVHYPPPLVRLKLIGFGLLIGGAAWGASFASARNWPTVPGSKYLGIPIAGPWMALGKSGCATDVPNCSGATVGVRGAMYVLDGIAQLAGVALIAEAIVMKTESAPQRKSALPGFRLGGVEVSAVPVASPTMKGLGFVGTF